MVLVGNDKGGTISVLDVEGDRFRLLADNAVGVGCSTFAVDAGRDLVFVTVREPEPAIVALRLDRTAGTLTEISRRVVDNPLAYLALAGNVLLGASYHGGWGGTWVVGDDGRIGERVSRFANRNLHSGVASPDGRHAYFASLGDDLIAQFALGADGTLTPLTPANVPCPAGSGPRHLVVAPDGRSVYLLTEFTARAIRFDRASDGALTEVESVPAFDPDAGLGVSAYGRKPRDEHLIWGADLALADGGRRLVCSERTASTVAAILLDAHGRLTDGVVLSPTEEQPRGLTVSPDGSRLVVVGELSGQASLYRIEAGALALLDRIATGTGPNWVRYV